MKQYPFTPNVRDADGGYFVYDSDGFAYFLLDSHKQMKSILLADEKGNPVEPFIDFNSDMIDMRDDGTIFKNFTNEDLDFRYYPFYYDRNAFWTVAKKLSGGSLHEKIAGFNAVCEFYALFPNAKINPQAGIVIYDLIAEGCEICENFINSENSGFKRQAEVNGKRIIKLALECPGDTRISDLAERVIRVI